MENKKFKIGFDARMYKHSGIGRYIRSLIREFQSLEHDFAFKLFGPKGLNELIVNFERFSVVECDYPIYTIAEQILLPLKFMKEKLNLLHIPHYNIPMFYTGKMLTTIHDLTHLQLKKSSTIKYTYAITFLKKAATRSKKIITPSKYCKGEIAKELSVNSDKVEVIYEGVNSSFGPLRERAESEYKYILYVGLLKPHKNLIRLIRAFSRIKQKYPNLKLLIIGKPDGNYVPEIIKEITQNDLVSEVLLMDEVSEKELIKYYQNAKVFVLPSLQEGFGLTILEALACGTPVAASQITSIPEVLGDAGLYFNPNDVQDIARNIELLLGDKSLKNELIQKGYKQAQKFKWGETAQKTLDIYKQVLGVS